MKIGISLSGGAARGLAHLGVLAALEELEVPIHQIAGISSGSLVGSFYASGLSPKRILMISEKIGVGSLFSLAAFANGGLLSMDSLEELLRKYLQAERYEDLKIPLFVGATDLKSGNLEVFQSGELVPTVLASCALPFIFKPVQYRDMVLVDGGLISTMLVEPLKSACDLLIGVHSNPLDAPGDLNSNLAVLQRSLRLSIHANAVNSLPQFDILIEPKELMNFPPHRFDRGAELYEIGYQATMEQKEEILAKVQALET
ncbi:MAG: patatin-like phospholipase family protein [Bacteroidota bacterium]